MIAVSAWMERGFDRYFGRRSLLHPLILGTILILTVWAGRWGLAGLHAYPAQQMVAAWENPERKRTPDPEAWNTVKAVLDKALALESGNAGHWILLGRMHHHQALTFRPFSKTYKKHLKQAADAYGRAVELRPFWGYPWVLLSHARVAGGDVSETTRAGLIRGMELAPWSGDVLKTGVRLGFALWPVLDEPRRQVIRRAAARAFPRHGDEMLRLAFKYGQVDLVRPLLKESPQWQWVYDRTLRIRGKGK